MNWVELFDLPLLSGTLADCTEFAADVFAAGGTPPPVICHINANNLELLLKAPVLRAALSTQTHMLFDGIGLKLAAAWLRKGWHPDICGTDLFPLVMDRLQSRKPSLFLIGGGEGIADRAAHAIASRWDVSIAGTRSGFFSEASEAEVCDAVNRSGAEILLVGRGFPLQEEFVLRNRHALRVRLIWVVGALFDYLAGVEPRAPLLVRKARLEWVFRWIVQPKGKAYRTWVMYPRFLLRVAKERVAPRPGSAAAGTANALTSKAPVKKPDARFSAVTLARTTATELLARHYRAPPYLIIFVSDRCWMKCSHCWFSEDWKGTHHTRPLLSFDHYGRLADSARLRFVSFTGGEAFGRGDLVELITMMRRKSGMTRYQIPTSGYLPEMIEEKADALLRQNPDTPFRVDVSLDGTPEIHERIRSIKGGWAKAVETIKRLNRLKQKHAHFDVGVITTVSRRNQDHVDEIAAMVRSFHPGEWLTNIARGNSRDPRAIDVDLAQYRRVADLADASVADGSSSGHRGGIMGPLLTAKNSVRRRIILDTLEGRRPGGGCAAGSLGGVIYADGEVHACEMLDDKLGNLHDFDYDLPAIWESDAAKKLRRHIQESRCQCTQECFLSVSMLIQPTALAGMAGNLAKRGVHAAARHLHA